jgi:hypothetical protein
MTRRATVELVQPLVTAREQHVVLAPGGILFEDEKGRASVAVQRVSRFRE